MFEAISKEKYPEEVVSFRVNNLCIHIWLYICIKLKYSETWANEQPTQQRISNYRPLIKKGIVSWSQCGERHGASLLSVYKKPN